MDKYDAGSCSNTPSSIPGNSIPILKIMVKERNESPRKLHNYSIVTNGPFHNSFKDKPKLEQTDLKPHSAQSARQRKDRAGNEINKGKSKHHITFKDDIMGGDVADVFEVETYKTFNNAYVMGDDDESCKCLLL